MYDEVNSMNIMTNKTQNMFREGKKRISAKEAMIRLHRRGAKINASGAKKDILNQGLYGMMQVLFIYCTWYMEDGSSIMENINWPECIRREIELEKGRQSFANDQNEGKEEDYKSD